MIIKFETLESKKWLGESEKQEPKQVGHLMEITSFYNKDFQSHRIVVLVTTNREPVCS